MHYFLKSGVFEDRECLKNNILPFIISDEHQLEYKLALKERDVVKLAGQFRQSQKDYYQEIQKFLFEYKPVKGKRKVR